MTSKNFYHSLVLVITIVFSSLIFPFTALGAVKSSTPSFTPECGFSTKTGRIIVDFNPGNNKLFANKTEAKAMMQASTTIPAGIYDIALVSYDGYSSRANTSPATQLKESWFAILKNNNTEIARTSPIDDLQDSVNYVSATQQVGTNFKILSDVNSVVAYHAAYATSTPNSIKPICAVFDKVATPNTQPTIILSATSTTITVGDTFNSLSFATASDLEDDIAGIPLVITASSTVPMSTPGTYEVKYNVSDSQGLKANEKMLVVNVVAPKVCTNTVMARIVISNFKNWDGKKEKGNMSNKIYLGSASTTIASGEWFPLYKNGAYINDPDMTTAGYEDVPGLAVQRIKGSAQGSVRVLIYGSHSNDGTKEYVDGTIEFKGTSLSKFRSDDSGNNKLENGFNGLKTYSAGQDEVWSENGVNNFWLTVTVADDGFYADYEEPNICPLPPNTKPVITLSATSTTITVGDTFNSLSFATANDLEDDIAGIPLVITASSTVATSTPGIYNVTYNVSDSQGLSATPETLVVNVVEKVVNENTQPIITLLGSNPIILTVGDVFTDPGATANDNEDGDITSDITASSTVATVTPGTYEVKYNVSDSQGLSAVEVTRSVVVNKKKIVTPPVCTTNCGGGGPIQQSLRIYNEKLEILPSGVALFSWDTDKPATSRVVYDIISHKTTTYAINIGYASSTGKVLKLTTKHTVMISGLLPDTQYFFRPMSVKGAITKIGNEKTFSLPNPIVKNKSIASDVGGSCSPIKDYLRMGDNNNVNDVKTLQKFLRDTQGFSKLKITGVFGQATFDAVSAFQAKYKKDVLTPWGIDAPTGYVYYTTRQKINEIKCGGDFSLNQNQKTEIRNFNILLEKLKSTGRESEIDRNTLGRANTPETAGKTKNTGLALANKKVENNTSTKGQTASVVGGTKTSTTSSTTTKSVLKKGILASMFGSVRNGFDAVLDSVKRFFGGNSANEDEVKENVLKVGTSTSTTVKSTTTKKSITK